MTTNTLQLCPGGCNEHLDPDYITNTVIIDGDPAKVCDVCLDSCKRCNGCKQYYPADEVEEIYISHEHGAVYRCERCAIEDREWFEWAIKQELEGRRFA